MRQGNIIRTIVLGAGLLLDVATAHAAVYYETTAATPADPGSLTTTGGGTGGGLCYSSCPSIGLGNTFGGLNAQHLITVTSPTSGLGNYLISVSISPSSSGSNAGSIWDLSVVSNGIAFNVAESSAIKPGTQPTGSILLSGIVIGTGTFSIGITDLTEQYDGVQDTLPGLLGSPGNNGVFGSSYSNTYSQFQLAESATLAPEPASISLFLGGIAGLGMLRRRDRTGLAVAGT